MLRPEHAVLALACLHSKNTFRDFSLAAHRCWMAEVGCWRSVLEGPDGFHTPVGDLHLQFEVFGSEKADDRTDSLDAGSSPSSGWRIDEQALRLDHSRSHLGAVERQPADLLGPVAAATAAVAVAVAGIALDTGVAVTDRMEFDTEGSQNSLLPQYSQQDFETGLHDIRSWVW